MAQGGEMTCPRLCTGAVTQVVSNNTFVPEKALKKRFTALHCHCCGEEHGGVTGCCVRPRVPAKAGKGGEQEWIHVL